MTSRDALGLVLEKSSPDISIVSSLGRTAQILFDRAPQQTLFLDAMGCVVPIATGIALGMEAKPVLAVDTDGSHLMGITVLSSIASLKTDLDNLCILVINNGILESAGGGRTTAVEPDWPALGKAWGLTIEEAYSLEDLDQTASNLFNGLKVIILHVDNRPEPLTDSTKSIDGVESKYLFVRHLERVTNKKFIWPARKN